MRNIQITSFLSVTDIKNKTDKNDNEITELPKYKNSHKWNM